MTSIGIVAASAGGLETLRVGLVQPLVDDSHQVVITLTPTAATWLDHIGELDRLEDLTAFRFGQPRAFLTSRSRTPKAMSSSAHR